MEFLRKVVEFSKELLSRISDSPELVKFVEELDTKLSNQTVTITSMVDLKDVELLANQAQQLDELQPPDLPLINTKKAIDEIAGVTDGSLRGGVAQLDRLQSAAKERGEAIKKLQEAKARVATFVVQFTKMAEIGATIAERAAPLQGNALVQIVALANGKNFSLSLYDYTFALVPALWARAAAAQRLEKKLTAAIKLAQDDLVGFEAARQLGEKLWQPSDIAQLDPVWKRIRDQMERGTAHATKYANELRQEARKIDEYNARLEKIQNLAAVTGAAGNLGAATTGTSGGGVTKTPGQRTDTLTVILYDSATGNYRQKSVTVSTP